MPQKWSYSGRNSLYRKNGKTNGVECYERKLQNV
jgi:hypothetical protein